MSRHHSTLVGIPEEIYIGLIPRLPFHLLLYLLVGEASAEMAVLNGAGDLRGYGGQDFHNPGLLTQGTPH